MTPQNLLARGRFRIKKSSSGYAWNFSWYEVGRGTERFEVLTNAKVRGAFAGDEGAYVVDVAVLKGGAMAAAKPLGKAFSGFANADLKTFIESKALVIYPMLLAQFLGIVLEIMPRFVQGTRRPRGHVAHGHFDPTLVALGRFSANADRIVRKYPVRGYRVNVVSRFDTEAAGGTLGNAARDLTPRLP